MDIYGIKSTALKFRGRSIYVKRDELIDPLLSGNKYWKLYALLHMPAKRYNKLISYGGVQSNAMLSMAALCHQKHWQFHYTCKTVPDYLKHHMSGNLQLALDLGMCLHEVSHGEYDERIKHLSDTSSDTIFIRQGGADPLAQQGIDKLADEIKQWQQEHDFQNLTVVTPSGTGTTAYYLAKALPTLNILTTAVVGDKAYLVSQMELLGKLPRNMMILEADKKYQFAKPYPELLAIYHELLLAGIEFDLIYGAMMWHVLSQHLEAIQGDILYVHSGGLMGNASMFERYQYKTRW